MDLWAKNTTNADELRKVISSEAADQYSRKHTEGEWLGGGRKVKGKKSNRAIREGSFVGGPYDHYKGVGVEGVQRMRGQKTY